jgi:hypothetical protein
MAFLSYIQNEAEHIFSQTWAKSIKMSTVAILQDEARHIRTGREIVLDRLLQLSLTDQATILASMKTHKAFLKGGIKRFFSGTPYSIVSKVLGDRYEFTLTQTMKGLLPWQSSRL